MADFKKIKAEYIKGNTSYRKLAEKYGVPRSTLERKAKDEKWTELRRQTECKAEAKIVENEANRQAQRMNRLLAVSDKLLDAVEKAVDGFVSEDLVFDKSVLKSLSGAIRDIKEIQSIKSELDIKEQKARISKLEKEAERENESDKNIEVVLSSELEEYSE
jgi:transposase-like protein